MDWPTSADYGEAVQNLKYSMNDAELRAGEAATDTFGLPMLWAGGFADVYKIHNPKTENTWALKCFTRKVTGQEDRYRHISDHLKKARLPFMVDFTFLHEGIRIRGQWFPALKMRWVEGGIRLNEFVEDYLDHPQMLKQLLVLWPKVASRLRQKEIAHADLQHGNVLLVPRSDKRLALRLIDYDGMHVPALAGTPSAELGHPAFQHPQRSREGIYSAEIDRFSHLAIYTAVQSLTVGGKELWERFNNGDNLLFREDDFQDPANSEVFHVLWEVPDADCRSLVGRLALACDAPLDKTPLLEDVTNGHVRPLAAAEQKAVQRILGTNAAVIPAAASQPAEQPPATPEPIADRRVEQTSGTAAESQAPLDLARGEAIGPPLQPAPAEEITAPAVQPRRLAWPSPLSLLRALDWPLKKIAGEENEILHYFLRFLALAGFGLLAFLVVTKMPQWMKAANRLIPERDIAVTIPESQAEPEQDDLSGLFSSPLDPMPAPMQESSNASASPSEAVELPEDITTGIGIITTGIGMQFKLIPAGEFLMGSPEDDPDKLSGETPQHQVQITQPFYLGIHEVTQEQYERVMGENPSRFKGATLPVEQVSWKDATAFCAKLSGMDEDYDYRLPTEAEWEYACRAGTTTRFSCGDELDPAYAWFGDNSDNETHPVGEKRPNAFGLYDMHGNVWEWCSDWYDGDYYGGSPPANPTGPSTGSYRVSRGGCWSLSAKYCRSAIRYRYRPDYRTYSLGFRVALVPSVGEPSSLETVMPARYTLTIAPPEAIVTVVGEGATIEGSGRTRTVSVRQPDGETTLEITAELARHESITQTLLPRPGEIDELVFHLKPELPENITNDVGMEFKLIPAGEFLMGSPEDDPDKQSDEAPQHRVRITKAFYLGIHEVTQEQYERVMGGNPSRFKGATLPVEQVSWVDATAFCAKLSGMDEDYDYRLPTEAEWEYACRAGTSTRYSCGDELDPACAWFDANSRRKTHPVGEKLPNPWGLYDMHGNVWEWCSDRYDGNYYGSSPSADPKGPSSGSIRVYRGGSWIINAGRCRSADRGRNWPDYRSLYVGFRVALVSAETAALPLETMPPPEPEPEPPLAPATPEPAADLPEDHTNAIGMQFKLIPAGEFIMGSPEDDPIKQSDETPQHRVRITEPFYLAIHEVTQEQYERVVGENPSRFKGPTRPVEHVSWDDATRFCEILSEMDEAYDYRLPTEAEWEYACRAGTSTRYSSGDQSDPACAWSGDNSDRQTHPVGEKRPNAWGLYDMHGNVWEWCKDRYDTSYYGNSPLDDPTGPTTGSSRVGRGGGWIGDGGGCRSASRLQLGPDGRFGHVGFRVVLVPTQPITVPENTESPKAHRDTPELARLISAEEIALVGGVHGEPFHRISESRPLRSGDCITSLPKARPMLKVKDELYVEMVDGGRLVLSPEDGQEAPDLELEVGRVILGAVEGASLVIKRLNVGGVLGTLSLEEPTSLAVLEVIPVQGAIENPETHPVPKTSRLWVLSGSCYWQPATTDTPRLLRGPEMVDLRVGPETAVAGVEVPAWVRTESRGKLEHQASHLLARVLEFDSPVNPALRAETEHRYQEVRRRVFQYLSWTGDFKPLILLLNEPDHYTEWSHIIDLLRDSVRRDPHTAAEVRKTMEIAYGSKGMELWELLWKFEGKELARSQGVRLVELLDDELLAARVLGFSTLNRLTGKGFYYRAEENQASRRPSIQRWSDWTEKLAP